MSAGAIAHVAAGIVVINRRRPKGERAGLVLTHLAIPVALMLLLSTLGGIF